MKSRSLSDWIYNHTLKEAKSATREVVWAVAMVGMALFGVAIMSAGIVFLADGRWFLAALYLFVGVDALWGFWARWTEVE